MKMTSKITTQRVDCPQCSAPLLISAERQSCQCAYCGSKFVVERAGTGEPHPVRFEAVLSRTVEPVPLEEVEQHLAELELAITDAEEGVEARMAELAEAKAVYREAITEVQKSIAPMQNGTYAAGLLATIAWFLVIFVLAGTQWYAGLAIAILLLFAAWGFHREWQSTQHRAQGELRELRETIEETKAALNQALACVEDFTLEQELWQRRLMICQQEEES